MSGWFWIGVAVVCWLALDALIVWALSRSAALGDRALEPPEPVDPAVSWLWPQQGPSKPADDLRFLLDRMRDES